MSTRKKKEAIIPPLNMKEAEKVLAVHADSDAKIQQITAIMDEEFAKIREQYSAELQDLNEKKEKSFDKIQMYAEVNASKLFDKKKSFEMSQGKIGFRTGTPALKAKKGYTLKAIVNIFESKGFTDYLKTSIVLEKAKLIADREIAECQTMMAENGLEIINKETFFIELKKEELATE